LRGAAIPGIAPLRLEDLDYELPAELIAQHPAERRDDARLLVVERLGGVLHDSFVRELPSWLRAGDALALNETRVRPARLTVRRPSGGRVHLLFVRPEAGEEAAADGSRELWRVLARPARGARAGVVLTSEDGALRLAVVEEHVDGERVVEVTAGDLDRTLREHGEIPLPPYIRRAPDDTDRERYQTVAAPTAGLHFTDPLLATLRARGIEHARVLLHVGPGTFRPIMAADPLRHRMDAEYFEVGEDAVAELTTARARGGRIVAVGTTVVRALESACDVSGGALATARGWTTKYIVPPYEFRSVDALLTNFHLPRTTLLLLVAALTGPELLRRAYDHAVRERYRFYSYGDAMLVV
jgi:S-adenosylmethionine:tRNA ribosyltransferase-isomerase